MLSRVFWPAKPLLWFFAAGLALLACGTPLMLGFVVSAVVAFIAVKWLLHYIQTHRFTVFAWSPAQEMVHAHRIDSLLL